MRAGTGYKEAAAFNQLHTLDIYILISAVGVLNLVGGLAESGRVEYDEVELLSAPSEIAQNSKRVAAHRVHVVKPVQTDILHYAVERGLRNVARGHALCNGRTVHRKAAAVAEAV